MYNIGEQFSSGEIVITQDIVDAYAEISTDKNPIHLDREFARSRGFANTIAHGRLTLAYINDFLTHIFGKTWTRGGQLDVKFTAPAPVGEKIKIQVKVEEKNNDIVLSVLLSTLGGVTAVSGTASVKTALL